MPVGKAKRAARRAKEKLSSGGGDDLDITQIEDQWAVIDGTDTHGPYDDRKKAAAKYRELKRAKEAAKSTSTGEAAKEKVKKVAGSAKRGAQKLSDAGESLAEGGPSPDAFGDQTGLGNGTRGPQLPGVGGGNGMEPGFAGQADDVGPTIPMAENGDANAPQLAFMDGFGDGGRDDGDGDMFEPQMPAFGGGGLDPAFGGDYAEDDGSAGDPFGGGAMMPGLTLGPDRADDDAEVGPFGSWGDGGPTVPMLDGETDERDEDSDEPPWMF